MSNVNGIGSGSPVNRLQALKALGKNVPTDAPAQTSSPARADRVELSGMDQILAKLKTNDVRTDKIESIRQQIAEGKYDTLDKFDQALNKLIDDAL
jgi:anti-sigma28 factor (negative regulator of flagellin synthesis)